LPATAGQFIKKDKQMELYPVYPLFDIEITKGQGCHVWDSAGQEYLDFYGGHAVISIGHCHPHYVSALQHQLTQLGFYSNSVVNRLQEQLAERLGRACGYEDYRLFLVNSGAEANENALKLASFHTGRKRILAASKAFHGRTSLAVEATDNPRIVAPVNDGGHVTFLPLNDLSAFETELEKGDVAAVIVECIQGVGGIRLATAEFMQGLRRACDKSGTVLICDEIQCGYGRSGRFFAHQHLDVRPDIITCAKGIGNGFPLGAVIISPAFEASYGQLGTTFGGNHLACTAALAVLDVMEQEKLVENAAEVGGYLLNRLQALAAEVPAIVEVRGQGLMIGIEFAGPIKEMRQRLVNGQHVFTGAASTNILRLLPPLCITMAEADEFIERLKSVI
jgi:acetylornithine aminotransferase